MSKISCDVCMDLLPLVKDHTASKDSEQLIEEHICECEICRKLYEEETPLLSTEMDDLKILKRIRKGLYLFSFMILFAGSILGIGLSNGMGMFYNFLVMPGLGAIGYFALKKKWYLVPLGIFLLSYVWIFIGNLLDGMLSDSSFNILLSAPLFFSTIYSILSITGVCISALLRYAFRKEGTK